MSEVKTAEQIFNEIPFLDRRGDYFNMSKTKILEAMEQYASQFKGKEVTEEEIKKVFPTDNENSGDDDCEDELNKVNEYRREGAMWVLSQSSLSSQFKPKEGVSELKEVLYELGKHLTAIQHGTLEIAIGSENKIQMCMHINDIIYSLNSENEDIVCALLEKLCLIHFKK